MPAQSAQNVTYAIAEGIYGTTPATPTFVRRRFTGNSMGMERAFTDSREMNANRRRLHGRLGNKNNGGDTPFMLAYGDFDEELEMCLGGTWAADVLKQGVIRRSATYERHFPDLAVPEYWRFEGSEIDTISFATQHAEADVFISCTASFISQTKILDTAIIAGATYAEPTTDVDSFSSFEAVLKEGGVTLGIGTEFSFQYTNGLARRPVIGDSETIRPSVKLSKISGSLTVYFENSDLIAKFEGETESSLEITFTDPAGNALKFDLPRVLFTSGRADGSGEDDILVPLTFEALHDATDGSIMVVTRTAA